MENSENTRKLSIEKLAQGLKLAREARGKTIKECSLLIGVSSSRVRGYEEGKYVPSLPEIESLSFFFDVPLNAIFNPEILPQYFNQPDETQLKHLLKIRKQFIATRLLISREKSGKTYKEISRENGISTSRIKKYEKGISEIPLDDLLKIAEEVGLDIEEVMDKESPIGLWQEEHIAISKFKELPDEIRNFILSAENQPFITFTKKMKSIGIENLIKLSDSIQKILGPSDPED